MALRTAFASTSRAVLTTGISAPCTCGLLASATSIRLPSSRATSAQAAIQHGLPFTSSFSTTSVAQKVVPVQMLRDDRIKLRLVRAVLTDAEGGLGEVERRDDVLKRIDRSKERMQQVDEQELSDFQCKELNLRPGTRVAVVKILNKKDAYDRDRAALLERKAKKKSTSFEEKEVQLTWGVSAHDLSHKLKKARQVLEKGGRVGLVVSSPKGSALPGREEREMFVRMVREMCGQEEGRCSTWKDELWRGGRTAVFLQGVRREGEGEAKSAEAP